MSAQEASLLPVDEFESGQSVRVFPRRVVAAVATLTIGTAAAFAVWTKQSTSLRGNASGVTVLNGEPEAEPEDMPEGLFDPESWPGASFGSPPPDALKGIEESLGGAFMNSLSNDEQETLGNGLAEAEGFESTGDGNELPMMLMSALMGDGPANDSIVEALKVFQEHLDGASEGDIAEFLEDIVGDMGNATNGTNGTDGLMGMLDEVSEMLGGLMGAGAGGPHDGMAGMDGILSDLAGEGADGGDGGNQMMDFENALLTDLGGASAGNTEDPMAGLNDMLGSFGGAPGGVEATDNNPFAAFESVLEGGSVPDT